MSSLVPAFRGAAEEIHTVGDMLKGYIGELRAAEGKEFFLEDKTYGGGR